MNKIMLHGRMADNAELKVNINGTEYCNFTIAVDRYMGKDKEKQADFIKCKAFSKTASLINTYFKKGKEIVADGSLHFDKYDKDGEKRTYAYVTVEHVEFCGGKSTSEQAGSSMPNEDNSLPDFTEENGTEEDLPF